MKNPFRRKRSLIAEAVAGPLAPGVYRLTENGKPERVGDVPALPGAARVVHPAVLPDHPEIPADVRAAIDKALALYPLGKSAAARFYGVPMEFFTKDELIRIVSWVGETARDKRRDS